eukprot:GHVN01062709.1.p1 GENE.GHVN01062709.1~~GHVN01062709.1.p1  ORF type:complete len:355 (-),score=60.21 GHVN01062709.1:121-1185(-)
MPASSPPHMPASSPPLTRAHTSTVLQAVVWSAKSQSKSTLTEGSLDLHLDHSAAFAVGVDVLDIDVVMTKDKVVVVSHDLTLNHDFTKDSHGHWVTETIAFKDITFEELSTYTVGETQIGSPNHKAFPHQIDTPNLKVPSLREYLTYLRDFGDPHIRLFKVIDEFEMHDRLEVQAFEWKCIIEVRKQQGDKVEVAPLFVDQPDTPSNKLWLEPINGADYDNDWPSMVKAAGGSYYEPWHGDITKEQVDKAHSLGLQVVVWPWPMLEGTDFDYDIAYKMIEYGVDGIITDRPDILRGVLAVRHVPIAVPSPNLRGENTLFDYEKVHPIKQMLLQIFGKRVGKRLRSSIKSAGRTC